MSEVAVDALRQRDSRRRNATCGKGFSAVQRGRKGRLRLEGFLLSMLDRILVVEPSQTAAAEILWSLAGCITRLDVSCCGVDNRWSGGAGLVVDKGIRPGYLEIRRGEVEGGSSLQKLHAMVEGVSHEELTCCGTSAIAEATLMVATAAATSSYHHQQQQQQEQQNQHIRQRQTLQTRASCSSLRFTQHVGCRLSTPSRFGRWRCRGWG
jgi:hypothetical protein